jgi:hypothetical protein
MDKVYFVAFKDLYEPKFIKCGKTSDVFELMPGCRYGPFKPKDVKDFVLKKEYGRIKISNDTEYMHKIWILAMYGKLHFIICSVFNLSFEMKTFNSAWMALLDIPE